MAGEEKPKEMWKFDTYVPQIMGPGKIVGRSDDGNYWYYEYDGYRYTCHKDKVIHTRRQAVEACYKYHEKKIKQEQKKLNERKRLLKKFYSEELYG